MQPETLHSGYRSPDDDFFCEKYGVWYPMRDCNVRVVQRTFEGCVNCFQGRVNLRWLHPRAETVPGAGGDLVAFRRRDDDPAAPPQAVRPKA